MSDRDELKRLKKENHDLKKKLYRLEMATMPEESENSESACYSAGNYFSFILAKARQKSFFSRFEKYFRNSMWVTRIFRWGLLLYQYLQAGAFVILYTAAFILIIPIILAFSLLTLIITLLLRDSNTRLLLKEAMNDIVFIIPTNKEGFDRIFLRATAEEYPESTVLIVSPFFFKSSGIGEKEKMYVCFRKESDNVYILRNYFFFYFRRKLKKLQQYNITEIHTNGNKTV